METTQNKTPETTQNKAPENPQIKSPEVTKYKTPEATQNSTSETTQVKSPEVSQNKTPEATQNKTSETSQNKTSEMGQNKTTEQFKVTGNWDAQSKQLKTKFSQLTDSDLKLETGKESEMLGRVQTKLNKNREEVIGFIKEAAQTENGYRCI
jgi:uncharacterized protein YjbJ (UPF0337 family)